VSLCRFSCATSADVDALDAATVEHDYDLDGNPNDAIAVEVDAQTIEPEVEASRQEPTKRN
jgi:hypothetical protein